MADALVPPALNRKRKANALRLMMMCGVESSPPKGAAGVGEPGGDRDSRPDDNVKVSIKHERCALHRHRMVNNIKLYLQQGARSVSRTANGGEEATAKLPSYMSRREGGPDDVSIPIGVPGEKTPANTAKVSGIYVLTASSLIGGPRRL